MISMIEHGIFSKSNCGEPESSFMSKHVEVTFFFGGFDYIKNRWKRFKAMKCSQVLIMPHMNSLLRILISNKSTVEAEKLLLDNVRIR
jgi:hypothetical protein